MPLPPRLPPTPTGPSYPPQPASPRALGTPPPAPVAYPAFPSPQDAARNPVLSNAPWPSPRPGCGRHPAGTFFGTTQPSNGLPLTLAAKSLPATPTAWAATAAHNPQSHLEPISPSMTPPRSSGGGNSRNISSPIITGDPTVKYVSEEVKAYLDSLAAQIPQRVTFPFQLRYLREAEAAKYQLLLEAHYGKQASPTLNVSAPTVKCSLLDRNTTAAQQTARKAANDQLIRNQVLINRFQTNTAVALHEDGTEPNEPVVPPLSTQSDVG